MIFQTKFSKLFRLCHHFVSFVAYAHIHIQLTHTHLLSNSEFLFSAISCQLVSTLNWFDCWWTYTNSSRQICIHVSTWACELSWVEFGVLRDCARMYLMYLWEYVCVSKFRGNINLCTICAVRSKPVAEFFLYDRWQFNLSFYLFISLLFCSETKTKDFTFLWIFCQL